LKPPTSYNWGKTPIFKATFRGFKSQHFKSHLPRRFQSKADWGRTGSEAIGASQNVEPEAIGGRVS